MAAARRVLAIAILVPVSCGSGELTVAEATRIIQEKLFPDGAIVESLSFREGAQCLQRDHDARARWLRTLASLGYLTIRDVATGTSQRAPSLPLACPPSAEPVTIELTSEGVARASREDWTVTTGTHRLVLARSTLGQVDVRSSYRGDAVVSYRLRVVVTPIGTALGESENRKPMRARFKRLRDGWQLVSS
jgi:hypothetical protein